MAQLTHVMQEGLVSAYALPWDGPDGFEALCERLCTECGGYFSGVEKMVQEAAFLLHLRAMSENELDFAKEKLELAFRDCLRSEVAVTCERVTTLLAAHPVALVSVLLRGQKQLQLLNMMAVEDTDIEAGRRALLEEQAKMEALALTQLTQNTPPACLLACCSVVCVEGSAALKKKALTWLLESGQSAVVLQLDEKDVELFLIDTDYYTLHSVYVAHGHWMRAASLLYEVCVLSEPASYKTRLTLQQRHEGVAMCIEDLKDSERAGCLERAPYREMKVPALRGVLRLISVQEELDGVRAVEEVKEEEALRRECEESQRFDLVLECLDVRESLRMEESDLHRESGIEEENDAISRVWQRFIQQQITQCGSLRTAMDNTTALMRRLTCPTLLPFHTILSSLLKLDLASEDRSAFLSCVGNCGLTPATAVTELSQLLTEMEDEKGKMIMGYVILEWLRRLPRERMQQEEVKYLVEMVVAELKGVISQQEEAEALCQSLCSFFSWGVCLVIAFPLFPVHCNGLSLSIDILRDCHPNELKQTHQLFALARIVSHKSTASVYKLDCFAPTFSK